MKFDLIIANPPYGKIGANITKTIIDNIEYEEYINLLPANDYNRNDTKDLYKYVDLDSMTSLRDAFKDAAVTTHCARINKKPHRYISWEEFRVESYSDPSLKKYFYGLLERSHYAIDAAVASMPKDLTYDVSKSIFINHRDPAHKHLAYSKNCAAYAINQLGYTYEDTFNLYGLKSDKQGRLFDAALINFTTVVEKTNIAQFMYSATGFRFISKVLSATNTDSWLAVKYWLPKVDWTRTWTVEEILADYGYTQKEIDEVIADLNNFKGMED